ncbi:fibronectin type III domain-containing protein, partial [Flavobacterium saliperosum]
MKKITLLFFALFSFLANAQVQVGSGTTNITTVPVSSCWGYSYTQQLYLASEINTSGNITELSFYYESGGPAANSTGWTIYLGHTTKTIFSSTTDWEPYANLTQAYTGTVTYPGAPGWMTITLDTPFNYNGSDNLVVAVDENTADYTCSVNFKGFAATNRGIYYRNDTTNPDPVTPPTGTRTSTIANIILGGIVPTNPPVCTALTTPANGAVNVFGSVVSWAGASGSPLGYLVNVGTSSGATDVLNNQDVGNVLSYDLGTLNPATTYYVTVIPYNDNGEASGCTESSFTTCDVNAVPSIENFATYVPTCWIEADNGDTTLGPATFGTSSWAADGFLNSGTTGAMKIQIDGATDNDWIISPLFSIPATGYELRYSVAATQNGGTGAPSPAWESDDSVELLVSTGTANWTVLHTYNDTNVPSFSGTSNTFDLSAYAGQNVRFAFRGIEGVDNGSANIDFFIDDFEVRLTPACPEPYALGANTITSDSANLFWTAGGSENTWNIEYGATGFTQGTGTVVNGVANPHVLNGLTPNTAYQYYVQADCGGSGASLWVGPFSFTTPCVPYSIPYFEGFEAGYTHNVTVAGCLSQASVTGAATWTANNTLTTYNRTPRTGAWNAFLQYSNEDWLFIPIDLTSGTSYTVSLYARQDGATAANSNMAISYGTSASAAGMTNVIVPATGIINGDYQQIIGSFTPAATGVYYVGIKGFMNGTPWYISLDDISIDLTPACAPPLGLAANSVTDSSAALTWTATTGNYQYVLDNNPLDPAGAGTDLAGEVYNASSLTPSTTYYFHVRTDCGAGTYSTWSTVSFTTLATPPANDDCTNAIALTPGGVYSDNPIDGTNAGATTSSQTAPTTCFGFSGRDVWYSVVVPASGSITIETGTPVGGGAGIDTVITAYTGDCTTPVQVGCDDDGATETAVGFSRLSLTAQTPGATILIRAYEYNNDTVGNFGISAYDASLSTGSFDSASFKAYPNPVKDVLNLSYSSEISSVEVYNMLGQKVITKNLNVAQGQIDMSNLTSGNYIVKVTSEGLTKTIKVV